LLRIWGLGLGVMALKVKGLGSGGKILGFRVNSPGFRVQGVGFTI